MLSSTCLNKLDIFLIPVYSIMFQELDANEKRVDLVNDLGSKLIDKGHINSDEIRETTNRLNTR